MQYSVNGTDWKDIPGVEPFKNTRHIQVDLSDKNIEAQYVRLENQENQESWIAFREFDVDAKVFYNAKAYTNVMHIKILGQTYLQIQQSWLHKMTLRWRKINILV